MPVQPHTAGPQPPADGAGSSGHQVGFLSTLIACTVATLIVVVGVIVTDAVDELWILAPVLLVVVVLSAAIFAVIARMLNDMGD